jgi:hypothetical protein
VERVEARRSKTRSDMRCGEVLGVPFIGRLGEWRGQEEGGRQWSLTPSISAINRGGGQ